MRKVVIGLKWMAAVAIAAVVTMVIGSVISTQRVIGGLGEAGASVGFSERLSMTGYDAVHFGTFYGVFIFIALLIAFAAGALVYRFAKTGRSVVYITAGATAMLVMLLAMEGVFFGVPIVGGARDALGLIFQVLAGAIGGAVFARLTAEAAARA